MYTPGYAPPELYAKGSPLGPWSDIYSIGASIYACMTGSAPQAANQRRTEDKMDAAFAQLEGPYSAELVGMVKACLALDPLARLQSVFAIQKILGVALPAATAARQQVKEQEQRSGGLRGLVSRIGAITRGKQT
jgi:serine/threonine protein kinase